MRIKRNTLDSFSTFLQFNPQGYFHKWQIDPRLQRSMNNCLAQETDPSKSTQYWSLYWHQIWLKQQQGMAKDHLFAYLQESCYQSAAKFWHQWRTEFPQDTIADYAQSLQTQIEQVLKSFSSKKSSLDISIYALKIFTRRLTDKKRSIIDFFGQSNWSMLRRASKTQMREALLGNGLLEPSFSHHLLAWKAYQKKYIPSTEKNHQKLTEPSLENWREITEFYNHERPQEFPLAEVKTIQEWIKNCTAALRKLVNPPVQSLNINLTEEGHTELRDLVSNPDDIPLLENLFNEDLKDKIHFLVKSALEKARTKEGRETDKIVQLIYVEQLKQMNIASKVNLEQSNVSRRWKNFRKSLLKFFIEILIENHIIKAQLDSEKISEIGLILEYYLAENSATLFN